MKNLVLLIILLSLFGCKKDNVADNIFGPSEDCRISISLDETVYEYVIPYDDEFEPNSLTQPEQHMRNPRISKQQVDLCVEASGTLLGSIETNSDFESPIPHNALGQSDGTTARTKAILTEYTPGGVNQYNAAGDLLSSAPTASSDLSMYEHLIESTSLRQLNSTEASLVWKLVENGGFETDSIAPSIRTVTYNTPHGVLKQWFDIERWIELKEVLYNPDETVEIMHINHYRSSEGNDISIPQRIGRSTLVPAKFNMSEQSALIVRTSYYENVILNLEN